MNSTGLFIYGFFVTVLVVVAIGMLVWGAVLDGRYNDEMRASREIEPTARAGHDARPSARRSMEAR
jgi:hypothetical protein